MNIRKRFIIHLLLGLGLWIILLGIILPITLEVILPNLGLGDERHEWMGLIAIGMVIIVGLLSFGWYFGSPLLLMVKWINQLTLENFSAFHERERMYTSKGKMKMRYQLYKEVFKQLEDMRIQLEKAKVEGAQVERAKQDWIAGISHDLKTPLTYIKGYSTLLLNSDYNWSNEEKDQFIQEIDDKGRHMEKLIEDLNIAIRLDGSRKVPLHLTPQNIVAIVQHVLADVSNDLRAQHDHFELKKTKEDIQLAMDVSLLHRALQNIYMNSILHNKLPVNISTSITQENKHVILQIEDDGIGMSSETKQHLFSRYYRGTRTDQSTEGTGLGMAIVKQIIEAHNGNIQVESTRNEGTIFTIILPVNL